MKKEQKKNKKVLITIIIFVLLITVTTILLLVKNKNDDNKNSTVYENTINNVHKETDIYDEIVKALNEKNNIIIYYYDNNTNKKINKEIKDYLNKSKINYYIYDNAKIDQEEYHKVLAKLNIDENLFGMPAIIYMYDGMMYANIINIDSVDTVKQFIEEYKLYEVK